MTYRGVPRDQLSQIQRRLRRIGAQNDRVHEWLARRIHREAIVTVSRDKRSFSGPAG